MRQDLHLDTFFCKRSHPNTLFILGQETQNEVAEKLEQYSREIVWHERNRLATDYTSKHFDVSGVYSPETKKNIYLIQPTFLNGNSVFFPYACGALAAYAWKFEDIKEHYELKKFIFLREKIQTVLDGINKPFLLGFSCYMWNFEYNKMLAREVKKRYPECVVVFGGQQIPDGGSVLEECSYVDVLIHNEGEIPFRNLLRAFINGTPLEQVGSLSFRKDDEIVNNPPERSCDFDFPSPYEAGFFDRMMEENPQLSFIPVLETTRGCPNHCTYCSWGSIKAGVRQFPLERVFFDLEWISAHKLDYIVAADGNFGMFPQDEIITDKVTELKARNGYPEKYQTSYTKNTNDRVFRIMKKLNESKMDKGVTLSFQSMSPVVQKNIGRANIDLESYKSLIKKYAKAGIPTYTELIIGLPGETVESFVTGIEELLELGQHTALYVHLCEWLPCAEMGKADYMKKYGLEYTVVPINQPHASLAPDEEVQEYSRIITKTASMSHTAWKQINLFAACVICFHHLGILQLPALYLFHECGVKYTDFYSSLLEWVLHDGADSAPVFTEISKRIDGILARGEPALFIDEKFGNISWTFDEYAFLRVVDHKDDFYLSIKPFLARFLSDADLIDEMLAYQAFVMKDIHITHREFSGNHDWKKYLQLLLDGEEADLVPRRSCYTVDDPNVTRSWSEYAIKVLWYGRKGARNIYTNEVSYADTENQNGR